MEPDEEINWTLVMCRVADKALSLCKYLPVDDPSLLINTFDHDLLGIVKFVRADPEENPFQFVPQNNLLRILVPKRLGTTFSVSISIGLSTSGEIDVANFRKDFQRTSYVNITVRGDERKLRVFVENSLGDPYEYISDTYSSGRLPPSHNAFTSLADICSGVNIPLVIAWDDICKKVVEFLDHYNAYTIEHHFVTISVFPVLPDPIIRFTWTVHVEPEVFLELQSGVISALVFAKIGGLNLAHTGDMLEINSHGGEVVHVLQAEITNISVVNNIYDLVTSGWYDILSRHQNIPQVHELIIFQTCSVISA